MVMIDWMRVQDLHDEIGAEAFSDVIDLFLTEIGNAIAQVRESPDPERLEVDLHFLKGGVLNLGFTDVAALCHLGEKMAAQGQGAKVDTGAIVQAYDKSCQQFLSEIAYRFGP